MKNIKFVTDMAYEFALQIIYFVKHLTTFFECLLQREFYGKVKHLTTSLQLYVIKLIILAPVKYMQYNDIRDIASLVPLYNI